MRALQQKRREQDDVAERLRIEQTKAVLQKAKAGMEREAKRVEGEKEKKAAAVASRFSVPAANLGIGMGSATSSGGVGKWVPPNRRVGAASLSASFGRMGLGDSSKSTSSSSSLFQRKIDVQDEEAFPDLASADKILEAKEKALNRPAYTLPTKKSNVVAVGTSPWGGTTASTSATAPAPKMERATLFPEKEKEPEQVSTPAEEKVTETEPKGEEIAPSAPAQEVQPAPAASAESTLVAEKTATDEGVSALRKKKKKKDISSFKVGGS